MRNLFRLATLAGIAAAVALPFAASAQAPAPVPDEPSFAYTVHVPVSGSFGETVVQVSEAINVLLILVAVYIMVACIRVSGTSSQIGRIFSYLLVGVAVIGFDRLFLLLCDMGVLNVQDDTVNLGWHIIFYTSMITFFIGARGFALLASQGKALSSKVMAGWDVFAAIVILLTFGFVEVVDKPFVAAFNGSWFDNFGMFHFIAFVAAALAAWYLFQRTRVGNISAVLAGPFLVAFLLLSGEHLWELLSESWHLIGFNPDAYGEVMEQVFVIPSCILFVYAFVRLKKLLTNPA